MKSAGNHILELDNVTLGYRSGPSILSGIRLAVRYGEMIALMGRNGTGKSTLLKSMIGLLPLQSGSCLLDRAPLQSYSLRMRARKISYVASQLAQLPSLSVGELVALGRMPYTGWSGRMGEKDREMVMKSLKEVRMLSYTDRKLDQLSDGERQRAMIARAFVQDTPLMVLDEPTAFLDIPNRYDLVRLLRGFREQGRSIVYSTHDMETAMASADKIWMIHEGQILEGAPEDLGISGVYHTLFEQSGIRFEEDRRLFSYAEPPGKGIRLSGGEGSVLEWTRIALKRSGFEIDRYAESGIEVLYLSTGPRWKVIKKGEEFFFDNIYELTRFLTKGI